ncbi:MAG: VOC family protein [Nitrososphaeraceae archaeon]|jgi:PhnB protein|nr:VOC family protein [Nitrososphaeraceae archaeon]MDW0167961.1 VOC family protein [Nitrososphaeraceae archaeon]MDW0170877.1 VOC family protein [Nitrososphaeraceae archaeon]MDW0174707.1 VOC family protein [Nitrososphaeraceae archaeon]MDW0177051.1 VOC family protein [Nitrososphaeraceae archaeon]
MSQIKKIPEGYHSITPVLIVKDGDAAIEFYKKGFDVEERHRMKSPDGRVAHAELKLGDSIFMLSDEYPEMKCHSPNSIGGSPVSMYVYVEDVDELFNRAVSAGAKVLDPVKDQFWGDRHGRLEDPFGHLWSIATHKKDLSEEEMKRAAEAAFSQMSK